MRFSGTVEERTKGEKGFVLAMTGLLIVPMLIFTAFAVDLGAWYGQGAKMQRAADAASLAGVVWLPDRTAAESAANVALTKNGFSGLGTFSYPSGGRQMGVTVVKPASQYFSKIVLKSETLTRTAVAEFNKPVPLGSPGSSVGNDVSTCAQYQPTSTCGSQPMLWSAIQGPYESHGNGDAFATLCATGKSGNGTVASGGCGWTETTTSPAQISNPDYKPDGYEFAIDVPASGVGQALTVQIWDAGEFGRTAGNGATNDCNSAAAPWSGSFPSGFGANNCQTGDSGPGDRNGINMQYQLWNNDRSDLTTNFVTPLSGCELFIPGDTAANPTAVSTYKNKWVNVCTFTPAYAGVYPMRVKSSNITRPNGTKIADTSGQAGWNAFSMKVTGSVTPKVYSIGDLSIWTNTPGSTARFYLANIGSEHKGKTIQLDLFDPGDGASGTYTLQLLAPPGAAPYNTPAVGTPLLPPLYGRAIPATNVVDSCYANTSNTDGSNRGAGTLVNMSSTSCTVTTRDSTASPQQKFQNAWLRFEIKLSSNYSCTTDCWWTIKYNFGSTGFPNDRTTWAMTILGDPVHLTK